MLLQSEFQLLPEQASTFAEEVDIFYLALWGLTIFFFIAIALAIAVFAVKYRRRRVDELPQPIHGSIKLETLWTVIPFLISLGIFAWGASLYFRMYRPPAEAMDIYVVGKQWMWKMQHVTGQREINELHVPVGRQVRLTMTTEDVIHSFFVPAFRIKMDVVPGRYTQVWFKATKPGRYHLFCAEYCGTSHSGMVGSVVVMEPTDYQAWLSGGKAEGSLASQGQKLFQDFACNTCHQGAGQPQGRGPMLEGLFGKEIALDNGNTAVVDETYIRESILNPRAKVHAGFQPVMPTFQGQISEEQLTALVQYIKSLSLSETSGAEQGGGTTGAPNPDAQRANPLAPQSPNTIRNSPSGQGSTGSGPSGPTRPRENRPPQP